MLEVGGGSGVTRRHASANCRKRCKQRNRKLRRGYRQRASDGSRIRAGRGSKRRDSRRENRGGFRGSPRRGADGLISKPGRLARGALFTPALGGPGEITPEKRGRGEGRAR